MRSCYLALLPLLAACNTAPTATTETAAAPPATTGCARRRGPAPPDTARAKAVSALGDTLRVVRQRHNFSRSEGPADAFRLVFRGPSVLAGTAGFHDYRARAARLFSANTDRARPRSGPGVRNENPHRHPRRA
ncbi:MAG: hypothetical protein WKG07_12260 [Hymenobacter sp.]